MLLLLFSSFLPSQETGEADKDHREEDPIRPVDMNMRRSRRHQVEHSTGQPSPRQGLPGQHETVLHIPSLRPLLQSNNQEIGRPATAEPVIGRGEQEPGLSQAAAIMNRQVQEPGPADSAEWPPVRILAAGLPLGVGLGDGWLCDAAPAASGRRGRRWQNPQSAGLPESWVLVNTGRVTGDMRTCHLVPHQTVDTFQAARDIRGKHRQAGGSGTGLREPA